MHHLSKEPPVFYMACVYFFRCPGKGYVKKSPLFFQVCFFPWKYTGLTSDQEDYRKLKALGCMDRKQGHGFYVDIQHVGLVTKQDGKGVHMRMFIDGTCQGPEKGPVWFKVKNIDYVTQELRPIFALEARF